MSTPWVCLVIVRTKDGAKSHLLDHSTFMVGRSPDADISLAHTGVSRLHLRVELHDELITITDQNSSNGTFLNGQKLVSNQPVPLTDNAKIRLGQVEEEWTFQMIPRPAEMDELEVKKDSMVKSIEDMTRDREEKSAEQFAKIKKQAELEAENIISNAELEAELHKTKALRQLQEQKLQLDAQIAELSQAKKQASTLAELGAKKEGDRLLADAHKRIQADYETARLEIEKRYKEATARAFEKVAEAESEAHLKVTVAENESKRIKAETLEEVRQLQQENLLRISETSAQMHESFQKEIQEKREIVLERAREEAREECKHIRLRFEKDVGPLKDTLERLAKERDSLQKETEASDIRLAENEGKLKQAHEILSRLDELEKRRDVAIAQFEDYEKRRQEGEHVIESELLELKQKQLIAHEEKKRKQEEELGKSKLRALEEMQKRIEHEEKRYAETQKLRTLELSERLGEKLLPKLTGTALAPAQIKSLIEGAVGEIMGRSHIEASKVQTQEPAIVEAIPQKKINYSIVAAVAVLIIICTLFRKQIGSFIHSHQGENVAASMLAERQIQSLYQPPQTTEFHDNYTDNVLFLKNYLETKTNPDYLEKWTLRLNNLEMARGMGLSEEDLVKYAAKEANLVRHLAELRKSIDAVYLDEGIKRMRRAEAEDLVDMKAVLKNEANYLKIHNLEDAFLRKYQAGKL